MRLVEVSGPMDDIDDGNALAQQVRRVPRAFDRPISSIRDAGRSSEAPDPHPVAIGGTIDGRCPGFGPADGEEGPPVKAGDHHLPMTGHDRQKLASAQATCGPDPLDECRIRRAILNRQQLVLHGVCIATVASS